MEPAVRTIEEKWNITYHHSVGPIATEFFRRLETQGELWGRRCPHCNRVLMPPRSFCDRCFVDTTEWVHVGNRGTIGCATVVYQAFEGLPTPPYCIAYVMLEGAGSAVLNYVRGFDLSDPQQVSARLKVGSPVAVRYAPERTGRMTDFWFEPGT